MENVLAKKITRKKLFNLFWLGFIAAAAGKLWNKGNAVAASVRKKRYAMVIDLQKCIGCEGCTVACKMENNVPTATSEREPRRRIAWQEVIKKESGEFPAVDFDFIPRPCMHCENPACVKVCPVGATYQTEDGLVLQRYDRCIGCRYCAVACPYGARYFNWTEPRYSEQRANNLNPLVPIRRKGIMEKCTFCSHRLEKAKEKAQQENRELRDGEVTTACVDACCNNARYFGDLNDPDSEVSKLARSRRAFRIFEEKGTNPKVIYLK